MRAPVFEVSRIYYCEQCFSSVLVPPEDCFQPFNRSNCGKPLTPIFYYYRPRSQCEIAFWMGCPTMNKFDSEFECMHVCHYREIGRNFSMTYIDYHERREKEKMGQLSTFVIFVWPASSSFT